MVSAVPVGRVRRVVPVVPVVRVVRVVPAVRVVSVAWSHWRGLIFEKNNRGLDIWPSGTRKRGFVHFFGSGPKF